MKQKLRSLDSFNRNHGDHKAKTPRTPGSNNVEKFHLGENTSSSKWNSIVLPMLVRNHQQEEDQLNLHPNRKPSVLSKVKEKAKKWRQTLARKKQGNDDNNHTSSKKATFEDYENNESSLHVGASAHRLEQAPDIHKENANNQLLSKPDRSKNRNPSSSTAVRSHIDDIHRSSPGKINTIQENEDDKHSTLASVPGIEADEVPMALQNASLGAIESPLTSLILEERGKTPSPTPMPNAFEANEEEHGMTLAEAVTEKLAPVHATFCSAVKDASEEEEDVYEEYKGVSVKDYLRKQLEPGEEEKALNWVISEVMDNGDKGVMEKVKEAMTSLLQEEEEDEDEEEEEEEVEEQQSVATTTRWHSSASSPQIPLSTNAHEVEEENNGRILQAN